MIKQRVCVCVCVFYPRKFVEFGFSQVRFAVRGGVCARKKFLGVVHCEKWCGAGNKCWLQVLLQGPG